MKKNHRITYGIYLPNDTEQWFNVTFDTERRARWYAEMNDLGSGDCDIRPVHEVEAEKRMTEKSQEGQVQEAAA